MLHKDCHLDVKDIGRTNLPTGLFLGFLAGRRHFYAVDLNAAAALVPVLISGPFVCRQHRQSLRDAHSFPGLEVSWEQGLLPAKTISGRGLWLYGCFHGLWWVIQLINVDYTIWCNGWISKLEVCTLRSKLGSLIRKVFANKRAKLRAERRSKKSGIWWELQWLNDLLSWSEIYITASKWPVVSFDFVWSFQIRGVFDVFWWGFLSSWKPSSEWPNSCEGRGKYSLLPP